MLAHTLVIIMSLAKNPQPKAPTPHESHRTPHHGHAGGAHGNPQDLDAYIERMVDPSRAEWQRPDAVLKALSLQRGQTVCDVGAGPGYFAIPIARAVGERGMVLALEVEPKILEVLRDRLVKAKVRNVLAALVMPDEPFLADGACDVVLVVDTFHHFPDGAAYLRRLARSLKTSGRLVNIDFHKRETPVGPPVSHRVSRDDFLAQAKAAGLSLEREHTFLPYQYFLVLEPK
jgi:ubiquinone/menaquinone biosynthesis C-methylase UbiE